MGAANMARPKTTGIKPVVRKAADGSVIRTDYYHRASGVPLGSVYEAALEKADELDGKIIPEKKVVPPSVFSGLCQSYLASDQFRGNAKKTQEINRIYVARLERRLGPVAVAGLTAPVIFAFKKKISDEIAALSCLPPEKNRALRKGEERRMTATIAKSMFTQLSILMTHAIRLGVIRGTNPAADMGGFGAPGYRNDVWTPVQCKSFIDATRGSVQVAAALLLYTAQRPSDCMAMTWDRVQERPDGRLWVSLRQAKTNELISVPAHSALAGVLRQVPDKTGLLAPAPKGGLWAYRNFARSWDAYKGKADFLVAKALFKEGLTKAEVRDGLISTQGLQRRDLRRTAMVRMAEAGATTAQIASVSGHSIGSCQRILDRYIPRRSSIAAAGIAAWEANIKIDTPTFIYRPSNSRKVAAKSVPKANQAVPKPMFRNTKISEPKANDGLKDS